MNHSYPSNRKFLTGTDILLVLFLVICAAGLFFFQKSKEPGKMVIIYSDNEIIKEMPMDQNASFTISTDMGTNTVMVENNQVYVTDADCPDKRCEKQGAISDPGEVIICLPHKLIIEVSDGK